jgi:hypothetical protein
MKIVKFCLLAGLAAGLPFAATAQNVARGGASDVKYCNALAKSYSSMFPTQEGMPVGDVVTLSRCDSDTKATIAALEVKLRDKKIDLPPDERLAQPPGSVRNVQ